MEYSVSQLKHMKEELIQTLKGMNNKETGELFDTSDKAQKVIILYFYELHRSEDKEEIDRMFSLIYDDFEKQNRAQWMQIFNNFTKTQLLITLSSCLRYKLDYTDEEYAFKKVFQGLLPAKPKKHLCLRVSKRVLTSKVVGSIFAFTASAFLSTWDPIYQYVLVFIFWVVMIGFSAFNS